MGEHPSVRISRVNLQFRDLPLPSYATEGASGMDICAAVSEDLRVMPGQTVLVPTGFAIELAPGFEAQVRPRSGLAIRHGITLLNSPGTIDSDYRGEIKIVLTNLGSDPFTIHRGDRIAQMVVSRYERVQWDEVKSLKESVRGDGGFGHTGIHKKASHGSSSSKS